jgi:hypothetical protein
MKGKIIGLGVVVLAISLSAFVKRPESGRQGLSNYWFPLDASGHPNAVTTLVYQVDDPYGCTFWGGGSYCAGSWSSYTGSGPYYAAGSNANIDFRID